MLIREATLDDLNRVDEVCDASGKSHWSPNVLEVKKDRLVVVAELEGKVVGVAKTHFHEDSEGDVPAGHYLGGIVVTPQHRRQGVATALTQTRLDWIWAASRLPITSQTNTTRRRSNCTGAVDSASSVAFRASAE